MKTILVTGATGFVGPHVLANLKRLYDLRIICLGRHKETLKGLGTEYQIVDINHAPADCFERFGRPDLLIHLAWGGLPDYKGLFHIESNLGSSYLFLKNMIEGGLDHVVVTGTCYEYGLHDGCLAEEAPTLPTTAYGAAKDSLRRFLELLRKTYSFDLKWLRLFFMYGPGQNPKSLIPQLDLAIASGEPSFDMSGGEQLRDFLPVETVGDYIVRTSLQDEIGGPINICSGVPISVRRLVEKRIEEKGAKLSLNFGVYPYPDYEPMAFWGDRTRLDAALKAYDGAA